MSEASLYGPLAQSCTIKGGGEDRVQDLQGYLTHIKTPTPLGPPQDPRCRLR